MPNAYGCSIWVQLQCSLNFLVLQCCCQVNNAALLSVAAIAAVSLLGVNSEE